VNDTKAQLAISKQTNIISFFSDHQGTNIKNPDDTLNDCLNKRAAN